MSENVKKELEVSNETAKLACVRDFVLDSLKCSKLSANEHGKVVLAVDEAVSNIMRHAYENFVKGTRIIHITFECDREKIMFVLRDSGKEFDPTIINAPDMGEHLKLGKRYGLGLFLMRRVMDEVKFVFRAGIENMLTMVKYINPPEKIGGQEKTKEEN